ncbi:uncharacterized protein LOC5516452 [Nematostella vectensis]|uniref:uncharacterized protein LOC5516452 n=1 Tax=Nematostella vectensis TaxID=45351 RepID=UPI0020779769|nr:uncharacterized protein LOC5516452 [Nematostella vectensis]
MKGNTDHFPPTLKRLGISLPVAKSFKKNSNDGGRKVRFDADPTGNTTYREDFKKFGNTTTQARHENINTKQGVVEVPTPSSPITTTFRSSFRGERVPPAVSCKPKWEAQPPIKIGPTGYSSDFCAKPLSRRSPPPSKLGNVLHGYPSNVTFPYTRSGQTVTLWKPFPVLPPLERGIIADELLNKISRDVFTSTYREDFLKGTV